MNKLITVILAGLIIALIAGCAHLTPQQKEQQLEQQRQFDNCMKSIYFVDSKDVKNYHPIDIISDTERTGNEHYIFEALKKHACEEGATALSIPTYQSGQFNTTGTSIVLIKK